VLSSAYMLRNQGRYTAGRSFSYERPAVWCYLLFLAVLPIAG